MYLDIDLIIPMPLPALIRISLIWEENDSSLSNKSPRCLCSSTILIGISWKNIVGRSCSDLLRRKLLVRLVC